MGACVEFDILYTYILDVRLAELGRETCVADVGDGDCGVGSVCVGGEFCDVLLCSAPNRSGESECVLQCDASNHGIGSVDDIWRGDTSNEMGRHCDSDSGTFRFARSREEGIGNKETKVFERKNKSTVNSQRSTVGLYLGQQITGDSHVLMSLCLKK